MSAELALRLEATFRAYEAAEERATRIWMDYKFLDASESEVQRANRFVAEARVAHLHVIGLVAGGAQ